MKIKTLALTSLALAMLLALPATAQTDYRTTRDYDQPMYGGQQSQNLVSCDKLIDKSVNTTDGNTVGDIEALVLHPQTPTIAYAVISEGRGFLGFGRSNLIAVPWTAFNVYRTGDGEFDIVLNASGEQLDNAIEVDSPDAYLGNERFIRDVYASFGRQHGNEYDRMFGQASRMGQQQYGQQQYGQQGRQSGQMPFDKLEVTKLFGTEVIGPNQRPFGEIDDMACETHSGQLVYAIIEVESDLKDDLDLPQNHVALPWNALQPRQDRFQVNVRNQTLSNLAIDYGNEGIRPLENQNFAMNVHQSTGIRPYWMESGQQTFRRGQDSRWDTRTTRRDRDQYQMSRNDWDQDRTRDRDRTTWDQPRTQDRYTWDQDRSMRDRDRTPMRDRDRTTYSQDRPTWDQERGTWDTSGRTWDQTQMDRNTWDMDRRRMSYRGADSPRWGTMSQRTMAQGQPVNVQGTIQHVYTHTASGMDEIVLHLQDRRGESVFVQAGPNWFNQERNVQYRKGDQVNVTGHLIQNPGQQSNTVLARTIETQNQTLTIRDRQLRPEWARR